MNFRIAILGYGITLDIHFNDKGWNPIKMSVQFRQNWPHFCLTCAKVYSGVQTLKCATVHLFIRVPICSKENDVLPQEQSEQGVKMPHVVIITGEVAAILILHLIKE